MNVDKPEMMIIGIAKPTMPLITPAKNATAKATSSSGNDKIERIASILMLSSADTACVGQKVDRSTRNIKTN